MDIDLNTLGGGQPAKRRGGASPSSPSSTRGAAAARPPSGGATGPAFPDSTTDDVQAFSGSDFAAAPGVGGPGSSGGNLSLLDVDADEILQYGYAGGTYHGHEESGAGKKARPRWGSRGQFVLVLMGYAIGLGNLWRFPYLCGKHGGGAFVLVYLLCLVCVAYPLFLLELMIGQYFQKGAVQCFMKLAPRMKGTLVLDG